jgi:hypothetical protein
MNENEQGWEEVKAGNFWSPSKEGESVEGIIIGMETDTKFGLKVTIEQKDKKIIVLPSHAVLQSRIKNCKVGEQVKVIFEKTELPTVDGHKPTNIYKVMKKIV